MIIKVFPGGWYASALPGGKYAVDMPARQLVATHLGDVPWKNAASEPLCLVATDINGWKFAGQGHFNGDFAVEYRDGQWRTDHRVAVGAWGPVIYDAAGELVVSDGSVGSQGYRYRDEHGNLIPGDHTLTPINGHDLHESIDLSRNGRTLVIGQRGKFNDEVQVWDGKVHRRWDGVVHDKFTWQNQCRVIRSERVGDEVAIGTYRIAGNDVLDAVCVWATVEELLELPEAVDVVPDALPPNVPTVAFTGFWRATGAAPGNAAIDSPTHPAVVADERTILSIPVERRLGLLVYLVGSDAEAIAALKRGAQFASEHDLVSFVYDDQRAFRYRLVKQHLAGMRVVLTPQWYLRANAALLEADESPADFARNVIAQAKTFEGAYLMPTIRATLGGWLIPAGDVVEALNELIRQGALRLPGFIGWLFWAWSRKDGVNPPLDDEGHPIPAPAFRPAVDLWMRTPTTVTKAQDWIAQAFPPAASPLAITIVGYTEQGEAPLRASMAYEVTGAQGLVLVEMLLDGQLVATSVTPLGTIAAFIDQPGEYRLKARVTVGDRIAETGAVRIVRVRPAPPKPEIPGITYPSQPGAGTAEAARKPIQEAADAARKEESGS